MTYKRDKKKAAAYQKAYRKKNREKIKAYFEKYRKEREEQFLISKGRVWERIKRRIENEHTPS